MNTPDVNPDAPRQEQGADNPVAPSTERPLRDRSTYRRPSDRIFRRSRASRARRKAEDKSDFRFISLILQMSVLIALVMVGLGVMAQKEMAGGNVDLSAFQGLATPWIGSLSKIEVGGIVLIMAVSIVLLLRWRARGR